jgi:hypothetical protein
MQISNRQTAPSIVEDELLALKTANDSAKCARILTRNLQHRTTSELRAWNLGASLDVGCWMLKFGLYLKFEV